MAGGQWYAHLAADRESGSWSVWLLRRRQIKPDALSATTDDLPPESEHKWATRTRPVLDGRGKVVAFGELIGHIYMVMVW